MKIPLQDNHTKKEYRKDNQTLQQLDEYKMIRKFYLTA